MFSIKKNEFKKEQRKRIPLEKQANIINFIVITNKITQHWHKNRQTDVTERS